MNIAPVVLSLGLALASAAEPQQTVLRGTVKQTLDAGAYTYVLIATKDGDRWAAIVKTALKKGAPVSVIEETRMESFESKILGRKFDSVAFGRLENAAPSDPHAGLAPQAGSDPGADGGGPVAKATGPDARTVAEVFAQKASLSRKSVVVRGRVVKYAAGIMGFNWLHLRDGSGTAAGRDNDIVATTRSTAAVGQVITVRAVVTVDKDLGSGYFFPVMLENAELMR